MNNMKCLINSEIRWKLLITFLAGRVAFAFLVFVSGLWSATEKHGNKRKLYIKLVVFRSDTFNLSATLQKIR